MKGMNFKMEVNSYQKFQELISQVDKKQLYCTICSNMKTFRLEKYNEFKNQQTHSYINPFSTENISALLDYNHNHYKRFESENDSVKVIPLEKLVKLAIILDKKIDDFLTKCS